MSKYQVKVGTDFDPEMEIKVIVVEEKSALSDWKIAAVLAVFLLILAAGTYGAASGDHTLYDKLLDTAVKVATNPHGKS